MAIRITRFRSELAGKRFLQTPSEGTLIPELLDFNIHNWVSRPTIENIWESDVTTGRLVAEERWGLVRIPFRTFAVAFTGMQKDDSKYLWSKVQRLANKPLLLPVYPDMVKFQSDVTAGDSFVSGDFRNFRFFPGVKAIVVSWDSNRNPTDIEIVEVSSVTSSNLFIQGTFAYNHSTGSRIYPLFTTDPNLSYSISLLSDAIYEFRASFSEKHDKSAIPPWVHVGNDPHAETFEQIPVFPYKFNRVSVPSLNLQHSGVRQRLGRGFITSTQSDRPRVGFDFNTTFLGRENCANALKFMDSRRGRVGSFWFDNIGNFWTLANITDETIVVNTDIDISDFKSFVKNICVVYQDGFRLRRRILAYKQLSSTTIELRVWDGNDVGYEIEAKYAMSESASFACPMYLCRNVNDNYVENWLTTDKLIISQSIIELPNSKEIVQEGINDLIRPVNPANIPDCDLSLTAGANSEKDDGSSVGVDGDEVKKWKNLALDGTKHLLHDATIFGTMARYRLETSGVFPYRPDNWSAFNPNDKAGFVLNETRPLHDNGLGLTIFLAIRNYQTPSYSGPEDTLVSYPESTYLDSDIFKWTNTKVTMNQKEGLDDEDNNIITSDVGEDFSDDVVVALIWKPGKFAQVYQNGVKLAHAAKPVQEMPMNLQYPPLFLRRANEAGDSDSADDNAVKAVTVFNRALTLEEFNQVGAYLGTLVSVNWGRVLSFHE